MSLLVKKLFLVAIWFGAIWCVWAPSSYFGGFLLGRQGRTEFFGFAGWYYVSIGYSRPYREGVMTDGVVRGIILTAVITSFMLWWYRRLKKYKVL